MTHRRRASPPVIIFIHVTRSNAALLVDFFGKDACVEFFTGINVSPLSSSIKDISCVQCGTAMYERRRWICVVEAEGRSKARGEICMSAF